MIGGIDVAGWLKGKTAIGDTGAFLKELVFGYRWSRIKSNIEAKDRTKHSPSVTLAIGKPF